MVQRAAHVQLHAARASSRQDTGTATSKFRFIATITTDPNLTEADLTLPDPAHCVEVPKPPIAAIARDFVTANEGAVVKFVDASSDPNNDIQTWHWDFGDGTTSEDQFPDHRYDDNGTYRVTLTVTDSANNADTTHIDVDVANVAPTAGGDDATVASGDAANVSVRLYDPGERDQEALTLHKSFGGEADMPVYADQTVPGGSLHLDLGVLPDGNHQLTVTVTDKDGATSEPATIAVNVGDANSGGSVDPDTEIETEPAPTCDFGVKLSTSEVDFVDLVTQYRVANNRARVFPSPTLTQAAEAHAAWLVAHDLFQHEGEGGNSPFDRAKIAKYPGDGVGENLARGPVSAPTVMVGWQVSNVHNTNMLQPDWHAIGIAKVDTPHGPLWVTEYGNQIDCPTAPPDLAGTVAARSGAVTNPDTAAAGLVERGARRRACRAAGPDLRLHDLRCHADHRVERHRHQPFARGRDLQRPVTGSRRSRSRATPTPPRPISIPAPSRWA